MGLLIDGYNLLYATGMLGKRPGPGGLEKARLALLNQLAASLDAGDLSRTTVVFDAKQAPRGAPQAMTHKGIHVRFAAAHAEADELIEELIRADSAPKRLTVVSSDHRLQTAARRRRATAIGSEEWWDKLLQARRERHAPLPQAGETGENSLNKIDDEGRLEQFEQLVIEEAERIVRAMNPDRRLPKPDLPRTKPPKRKR